MELSISKNSIYNYIEELLNNYLPDNYKVKYDLKPSIDFALQRIENCFKYIKRKYYTEDNRVVFNHLNSDHFATFLYFLSNTVWNELNDEEIPTRLFYLNKIMHGLDLYFSIKMPDIFMLIHPVGTVIGNAHYNNYLVIYQNCTIGADGKDYPSFGEGCVLYSKSSVLGNCKIGNNVIFGANTFIINTEVEDNKVVVGQFPEYKIKENNINVIKNIFTF